jgi:PAS domain S-box-containing protein
MRIVLCIPWFIGLLLPSASWAHEGHAPVWDVTGMKPPVSELSSLQTYYRDETGSKTIDEIVAMGSSFQHGKEDIPSFGFTKDTIWTCIHIRSEVTQPVDLIVRLGTARLSHASWYLVDEEGRVIRTKDSGFMDETVRGERMPMFRWSLSPGVERRLFLRVSSDAAIWLPLHGGDTDLMHQRDSYNVTIDALLMGFSIAIAIFIISSGWIQQSRMHCYLALSMGLFAVYYAIFHGYCSMFWPAAPQWVEREMIGVIIGLAASFFALFNGSFLQDVVINRSDRMLKRIAIGLPLVAVLLIWMIPFSIGIQLVNALSALSVLTGLLIVLRQGLPRGEQAWYIGAWALLGSKMILFGLQFSHVIPVLVTFRQLQLIAAPVLLMGFFIAVVIRQKAHASAMRQRHAEKQAHDIISHISAGTFEVSLHRQDNGSILPRFHFMSPQYLKMFEISYEELEANPTSVYERIHPDDRASLQKANTDAMTHLSSFRWEGRLSWGGQTRWMQASSRPRVNSDGVTVWAGVITDITSQKQAQEALQRTLENLPVPISCDDMCDPPHITMINEQFVKTFGYSHEEIPTVADWALRAYPDPAYREEIMSWWFRAVELARQEKGKIESREIIVRCKDGTDKEIIISTTMLEHGMILAFLDITERNRTARQLEALRTSREKSAFELTENMPAGTYALRLDPTPEGKISMDFRFASSRMLEFFDISREAFQSDPNLIMKAIHPEDRESLYLGTHNAYHQSEAFYWEGRTLIHGNIRWLNIRSNPRSDHEGRIVWEGVINDITAHIATERMLEESLINEKRLRTEAEQLRREAERAHEAKSLFLAKMSHEIRTPLSALVSLSQAMWMRGQKHAVDEEFTPFLNRVRSGGQYLNLLLRNVLNVSAAESGQVPVKPEEFYVADWVADIQNILEPIAEYYRGKIEWRLPEDDEARWTTDQMRLTQIVLNLCENALKFSIGQKQPVQVAIQITPDFLEITVIDHGPGIPLNRQASLFSAFSQGGDKISPLDEGVGLGLTVVKINTELLHGDVHIQNLVPNGTVFTVRCPSYTAILAQTAYDDKV